MNRYDPPSEAATRKPRHDPLADRRHGAARESGGKFVAGFVSLILGAESRESALYVSYNFGTAAEWNFYVVPR